MCGYIGRDNRSDSVKALLNSVGFSDLTSTEAFNTQTLQHFYPAFGGDARRTIDGLIIRSGDDIKPVNATWWFDCTELDNGLKVGDRTTFNARNLDSPYWKGAIRHHRGVVVATQLGERGTLNGKSVPFLMEGQAFLLGAVYRPFANGCYSCSVITCAPTPGFAQYHEKAMPLFLPHDKHFLQNWLDPGLEQSFDFNELLNHPQIFTDLQVTPVKTYKSRTPMAESAWLRP